MKKKIIKLCTCMASAVLFLCPNMAYANGNTGGTGGTTVPGSGTGGGTTTNANPVQMINNLNAWLLGIFAALGVTVCIFGIVQLVSTWSSHDMTQRINSILIIVAGVALIGIGGVLYNITGVQI